MTDDPSAKADARTHAHNDKPTSPQPEAATPPPPKPAGWSWFKSEPDIDPVLAAEPEMEFHPSVIASSRIKNSRRRYEKRAEVKATNQELINLSGKMIDAIRGDGENEENLKTQSVLINDIFNLLVIKAASYEGFSEDTFGTALKAQHTYMKLCEMMHTVEKRKEQTEKTALNLSRRPIDMPQTRIDFGNL